MIPRSGISQFRSLPKIGKSNKASSLALMKTMPHSFHIHCFVLLSELPGPNFMSVYDLSPVLKRTFCICNAIIHSCTENEVSVKVFFSKCKLVYKSFLLTLKKFKFVFLVYCSFSLQLLSAQFSLRFI